MLPFGQLPAASAAGAAETTTEVAPERGHYDVLGIPRSAAPAAVRRAYRQMALRTHPDKGGNPDDFLRVTSSFEVLSDCARRAAYDLELDQRGCQDGRHNAQESAGFAGEPSEVAQDAAKAARGAARAEHLSLMAMRPAAWASRLAELGRTALEALAEVLRQLQPPRRRRGKLVDAGEFPREIDPPEFLPPGWKCMEHVYKSGKSKGMTYCRYTSPWGRSGVMSVPAAIKAEIDHQGPTEELSELLHRCFAAGRRRRKEQEVGAPAFEETQRTLQRYIYAVRGADGVPKYWVSCTWSGFRVYTKKTLSLTQAIDWHIAICATKEAAQARMRNSGESIPVPLSREELSQLLQVEPDLQLNFVGSKSGRDGRKCVSTPCTGDLGTALKLYRRFHMLVDEGATKQTLAIEREAACAEVAAVGAELAELHDQLQEALAVELERRGLAPKLAPSGGAPATPCAHASAEKALAAPAPRPELQCSPEAPAQQGQSRQSQPKKALATSAASASHVLAPAPSQNRLSATRSLLMVAAADLEEEAMEQAREVEGTVETKKKKTGVQAKDKRKSATALEVKDVVREKGRNQNGGKKCDEHAVAMDLQAALGLTCKAALSAAKRLRLLPRAELARRVRALFAAQPPQGPARRRCSDGGSRLQVRGRAASVAATATPTPRRRAPPPATSPAAPTKRPRLAAGGSAGREAALALPWWGQAALRNGVQSQAKDAVGACRALPPPFGPPVDGTPLAGWLPGVPADPHILRFLDLAETALLRAAGRAAAAAGTAELRLRLKDFTYADACLSRAPAVLAEPARASRRRCGSVPAGQLAQRLAQFFGRPLHSTAFERVDVSKVPADVLGDATLQAILGQLPCLTQVVLPAHGWGAPTDRRRFIASLPPGAGFEGVDAWGVTVLRGVSGDL